MLPIGSHDAVLFLALPAGRYTAQLFGIGDSTGTALIEVYVVGNSPIPFITIEPVNNESLGAPTDDGAGFLASGPDAQPQRMTTGSLVYPLELVRAGIVGEVLLDFYIKTDGTVANVVALHATDIRFANAAIAALKQCTFSPAKKNGRLVTAHVQQQFGFKLHD